LFIQVPINKLIGVLARFLVDIKTFNELCISYSRWEFYSHFRTAKVMEFSFSASILLKKIDIIFCCLHMRLLTIPALVLGLPGLNSITFPAFQRSSRLFANSTELLSLICGLQR
jgi:hypothetical protein